jgi:hypothetical protein
MTLKLESQPSLLGGMAIHELVVEAHHEHVRDRRSETRYPFFRPVSLEIQPGSRFSAFTREISSQGIGLLHNFDIRPSEIELYIPHRKGQLIRVRTRIIWCQERGDGWFTSGGVFAGVAAVLKTSND